MPGQRKITGLVPLMRDWLFSPLPPGTAPPSVPDSDLSTVHLPHNAAELSWKQWDPASWERAWLYRKRFPATGGGQRYFLLFDGVLTTTTPALNGHELPEHPGGYGPFQYEITEQTRSDNVLDVVVDGSFRPDVPPNWGNGEPSTAVDFWQPAGIYRPVSLLSLPANFIADVFAKPVDVLDPSRRHLNVLVELDIASAGRDLRVEAELRRNGTVVASTRTSASDLPVGRHQVALTMEGLRDIELWSPNSPVLYEVAVALFEGTDRIHGYEVRTGFRQAYFDNSGFYLNGERLQLFGLSRHHLYPYAGAAMPPRVQRRDLALLRNELNCNVIRFSTYPHDESLLDACDELGVLVWDEPPGWQFLGTGTWLEHAARDLTDVIRRDRNHPCVILWAARLNETPGNAAYYERAQRLAKSLDDSRQTTGAMLASDHDTTDFQQDVFSYNDYAASTGPDGEQRPELLPPREDLPYLVSEAVGTLSGPAKYYRRTDSQTVQQGQALAHARVHDIARSNPGYSGVIAWLGIDYQSGNGNIERGIKWPGVIDVFRVPKPAAAMYRAQVDPQRRAVIEPSFYWDFHPGSPVSELGDRAAIWSNLQRLELFIDGRHHASLAPAGREFGSLPYPPFFADFSQVTSGDLRIEGYLGDELVLTRHLSGDRGQDRLRVSADDPTIVADGSDATRVEFRVVDRYGADRPYVGGALSLELDGPATLIGDNPFPLGETGGAGAVWLRSVPDQPGTIRLLARHATAGTAEVTIEATAS